MILYQRMRQYLIYILLLHKIQFIMQSPAILHRLTTPVAYVLHNHSYFQWWGWQENSSMTTPHLVVTQKKPRTTEKETVIHTDDWWQQARGRQPSKKKNTEPQLLSRSSKYLRHLHFSSLVLPAAFLLLFSIDLRERQVIYASQREAGNSYGMDPHYVSSLSSSLISTISSRQYSAFSSCCNWKYYGETKIRIQIPPSHHFFWPRMI